jgi:ElaB/YqjD/DUF883 family membrane-anchored ribosome-binding protein
MSINHERRNEQAKSNASSIEHEIESLKQNHRGQPHEFWAHAKEISGMFKMLKPLLQEDREALWAEFSSICESAKREMESRQDHSKQKRDIIESKIQEARYQAQGAGTFSELSEAKSMLNEALQWMKDGWGGFNIPTEMFQTLLGNEGKLLREDRDQCWEKWKEANDAIKYKRQELCNLNYDHFHSKAYDALNTAHYNPREAKSMVIEIQQEMKGTQMTKPQFQEIHDVLNNAWQEANSRLKEAYQEKQRKHHEWLERMQEHIERWSELIEKNEDVIAGIEKDIDRCEEMEAEARTGEFGDTVRGWIEEKYKKIEDIRETNRELEEKIRSVESKIRN